jgi:hypothetical protein
MAKLTDRFVDDLPIPATGNKRVPDSEVRGFCAVVTANGERSFALRYRVGGRERLFTIGSPKTLGLYRGAQPGQGAKTPGRSRHRSPRAESQNA